MAKYTLTFLRHGESDANLVGIFQGQTNTDLTERGKGQVYKLIQRWQAEGVQFDAIISSPLERAHQTAQMIGKALNVPVETDPIWMERDTGKLTGMDRESDMHNQYFLDFYTPFQAMGGTGEGDFALFIRAGKALDQLLKRPVGKYLVVSHGGILNQVLRAIIGVTPQANGQGVTFRLVNTAFASLTYDPETFRWTVLVINDHAHLKLQDVDASILDL